MKGPHCLNCGVQLWAGRLCLDCCRMVLVTLAVQIVIGVSWWLLRVVRITFGI